MDQVLITGPGRGGGNITTEIVRASGYYNFTEQVEDRNFFNHDKLPDRYGTKLATENKGFTHTNVVNVMHWNHGLKVLFAFRHPTANCMSKIVRGQPSSLGGDGEDQLAPDATVIGAIEAVNYAYDLFVDLVRAYPKRVEYVKLEDYLIFPPQVVNKVVRFLGIPKNDEMVKAHTKVRNKYISKRYRGRLEVFESMVHINWKTAYGGFFADKPMVMEEITRLTKHVRSGLGYN